MQLQEPYLQNFIFFKTLGWTEIAGLLQYRMLETLDRDQYSSLLGPFINYKYCIEGTEMRQLGFKVRRLLFLNRY